MDVASKDNQRHVLGIAFLAALVTLALLLPLLPMASERAVSLDLLNLAEQRQVVVAPGYVGCADVCPTNLAMLASATRLNEARGGTRFDVIFLNVDLGGSLEATDAYARSVSEQFRGAQLSVADSEAVYRDLALRSFSDARAASAHSGTLYLFEKHNDSWHLKRAFWQTPSAESLLAALG